MDAPRSAATRVADAARRLAEDADAWLATAGPDGPWLIPLSPVWDGERIWFATDADTPTGRNLRADPRVRVAFGHTRDVVMIDGTAELLPSAAAPDAVIETYRARHDSDPRTWADSAIAVRPLRVQAWREEPELRGRTIMRDGRWLT